MQNSPKKQFSLTLFFFPLKEFFLYSLSFAFLPDSYSYFYFYNLKSYESKKLLYYIFLLIVLAKPHTQKKQRGRRRPKAVPTGGICFLQLACAS
jgi:hypothetical protein